MWRVTFCIFGSLSAVPCNSLQDCIEAIHRQWELVGFENIVWYKIEEFYNGKWGQHCFYKL